MLPDYSTADGATWGAAWKRELGRNWDSFAGINTEGESIAYEQNRVDLDPNYRDRFGQPLLRLTFDWTENEQNCGSSSTSARSRSCAR